MKKTLSSPQDGLSPWTFEGPMPAPPENPFRAPRAADVVHTGSARRITINARSWFAARAIAARRLRVDTADLRVVESPYEAGS